MVFSFGLAKQKLECEVFYYTLVDSFVIFF